jgi:hypothetical protein
VVTALVGVVAGVLLKWTIDFLDRHHREHREDRHRFADHKRELYVRFTECTEELLSAVGEKAAHQHTGWPEGSDRERTERRVADARRAYGDLLPHLLLVAPAKIFEAAEGTLAAGTRPDAGAGVAQMVEEYETFKKLARKDLGAPGR